MLQEPPDLAPTEICPAYTRSATNRASEGPTLPKHEAAAPGIDSTVAALAWIEEVALLQASKSRYRFIERLARGGRTELYRVFDLRLERELTLKTLSLDMPLSRVEVTRFLEEGRLQAKLAHPAIPAVHDICVGANGRPYFTMDRVPRRTLSRLLSEHRKLGRSNAYPLAILVKALATVSDAVACVHAAGVCHRNLRSSNILIDSVGRPYLIDFGSASAPDTASRRPRERLRTAETPTKRNVPGKPGPMAPERPSVMPIDSDPREDVYALGIVLREILALVVDTERIEGPRRAISGSADAVSQFEHPIEARLRVLRALSDQCTQRAPSERLETARILSNALRRILGTTSESEI